MVQNEMFIGRKEELDLLQKLYSDDGLKTCMIYGRRQIGKSALIRKFCEGKRHLIIQSSDVSSYENRTRMLDDISLFLKKDIPRYDSFTQTMREIADICNQEKTIVVFDEYSYLIKSAPEFPSILQRMIDVDIRDSDSMVIISGSSISVMCDEVQSYNRPLYGRFMNRMKIGPLSLKECSAFHEKMSKMDQVKLYLTVGGVPKYHLLMNEPTYAECVKKQFLSPMAKLNGEAPNVITSELQSTMYTSIIACIADGSVSQYEIADKLRCERPNCKSALDRLMKIDVVSTVHPMLDAPKRPIYHIKDDLAAFHYSVMRKYQPMIENGMDANTIFKKMQHDIETFLGRRYEWLCGAYLSKRYAIAEIGKWWGKDSEIDIVAKRMNKDLTTTNIVAECKFTKKQTGMKEYEKLNRMVWEKRMDNVKIIFFSINGFDDDFVDFAEEHGIELVDIEKMFAVRRDEQDLHN